MKKNDKYSRQEIQIDLHNFYKKFQKNLQNHKYNQNTI